MLESLDLQPLALIVPLFFIFMVLIKIITINDNKLVIAVLILIVIIKISINISHFKTVGSGCAPTGDFY